MPEHSHPFWQVEVVTHGPIQARAGDIDQALNDGQVLLIPPHCEHQFIYEQGGEKWFSIKFSSAGVSPDTLPMLLAQDGGDEERQLIDTLLALLPPTPEPDRRKRWVLEHVLGALLACRLGSANELPRQPDQPLIGQIAELVESSGGRRITVSEVADHLGYSISHVSSLFRKHCDMPLKTYLDLERSKVASRLLEYSDLNITEIAGTLEFPDVFSFSRFFRRVVGMSPRPFRRSVRARHESRAEVPPTDQLPAEYVADQHAPTKDESSYRSG